LEQMPTAALTVDLNEWRPDEDPQGFIDACLAMAAFGCNVTMKDDIISIEGPAPVIETLLARMGQAGSD
ncbi:hypothetical protein LCGC14_1645030, partial [marine sediment metagenome]